MYRITKCEFKVDEYGPVIRTDDPLPRAQIILILACREQSLLVAGWESYKERKEKNKN